MQYNSAFDSRARPLHRRRGRHHPPVTVEHGLDALSRHGGRIALGALPYSGLAHPGVPEDRSRRTGHRSRPPHSAPPRRGRSRSRRGARLPQRCAGPPGSHAPRCCRSGRPAVPIAVFSAATMRTRTIIGWCDQLRLRPVITYLCRCRNHPPGASRRREVFVSGSPVIAGSGRRRSTGCTATSPVRSSRPPN